MFFIWRTIGHFLTMIIISISVIIRCTSQNADDPEPEAIFDMEQMATFLQNLQQAASDSNR